MTKTANRIGPFTTVTSRRGVYAGSHEHATLREAQAEFNNRFCWGMADAAVVYDHAGDVVVYLGDYR